MGKAAEAGIDLLRFWDMTYREVYATIGAYYERRLFDIENAIRSGHTAGQIGRAKRIPKLADLLKPLRPRKVMDPKAIRNAIVGINRALGGKVRYVPKGTIRGS